MNKRQVIGAFLIITALIIMLLPAAEADAETSASAFTVKSGELVKYNGTDKTVSVPSTVTSIGESAFEDNLYVEKVILPDSVKMIGAYAFWGCDNLKTVTLGKKLISIGDFSFMNCTGLQTMQIPSNIRSIGIQAFAGCERLEDITVPPEVTSIQDNAFDGDYLLNIHCEEGSYADKYAKAFYERQKNMPVYDRDSETDDQSDRDRPKNPSPDGVYSGADVQGSQPEPETVQADPGSELGSTKVVGNRAFVLMQNAAPFGGGSEGQTPGEESGRIAERSHYRDEDITRETLAEDVREIGPFAYARSGLRSIELPEGLESIDYAAFYHCDALTEVELPESVERVASKAFAHTPWVENFLNGAKKEDGDFLISGGVLAAYRGTDEEVIVPEGVRVIAGDVFEGHEEIRKVVLPASLQAIDESAFAGCDPQEVEYSGGLMDEETVQERVVMQSHMAPADSRASAQRFPFNWIGAIICLTGGVMCILWQKA